MNDVRAKLVEDIRRLTSPDHYLYAGIPHFKGLYGRDALISAWQLLGYDPGIARATLSFLAAHQGRRLSRRNEEQPGKMLHVYDYSPSSFPQRVSKLLQRVAHGLPYFGSLDSTPLFIIVAKEYFDRTRDVEFISGLWPNIEKAVHWMAGYGDIDNDGFLQYRTMNLFGLRNQGWKDTTVYLDIRQPVAPIEVQGYAYAAYRSAARMASELGRDAADWEHQAERLRERLKPIFWMPNERFFAIALDGDKKLVREIASNPGHLLFSGILDPGDMRVVVERLFKDDMLTQYGLRTHSAGSRYFRRSCTLGPIWPHDNWIIWMGLKKCGYPDEAERIKVALFMAYAEIGFIPEYYDVVSGKPAISPRFWGPLNLSGPSHPQAWASGALLSMLEG